MKQFANGDWTHNSYLMASIGLSPRPHVIREGEVLYRFIDLNRGSSSTGSDGPWWFEFDHYRTIATFAERNGYSLGYSARLFAAIMYEFSEVNAVLRAQVIRGPLTVWKGPGKQVTSVGNDPRDVRVPHGLISELRGSYDPIKMTPMQGPSRVLQLFVPGLGHPHFKFSTLMRLISVEQIAHHNP